MKLTIVISYYKALDNLRLILAALQAQSVRDFVVIVSEDDNDPATADFIEQHRAQYFFELIHLHQDVDDGFRKNQMLNKCLRVCKTPIIAYLDGDCIPHRHFAKQYIARVKEGGYYTGRSVMLGPKFSAALKESMSLGKLNLRSILFSDSESIKDGIYFPLFPLSFSAKGIHGRNWGILAQYLRDINGYDEDYVTAGIGEDTDVEWRLKALGLERRSMKNLAVVYHIWHKRHYSDEGVQKNIAMMESKKQKQLVRCLNGLEKLG